MRTLLAIVLTTCCFSLPPSAAPADEPVKKAAVREIDPKGRLHQSTTNPFASPIVVTAGDQLKKKVVLNLKCGGYELLHELRKDVDFEKEQLLFFVWSGSKQDKLTFQVQCCPKHRDHVDGVVFHFNRGAANDNYVHYRLIVVPKHTAWDIAKAKNTTEGQEKKEIVPRIDVETIATFKKLGAEYGHLSIAKIGMRFFEGPPYLAHQYPAFRFKSELKTKLPVVNVPFGLELASGTVTDAGLKNLGRQKNLIWLQLGDSWHRVEVTDSNLATLRKNDLLHTLSTANLHKVSRPKSPDDVADLALVGSKVTDAGLKELELAGFKNLKSLQLGGKVTDAGLEKMRKALPKCDVRR